MKKRLHYGSFLLLANGILVVLSLGIWYNHMWGGSQVGFFGALQLITLPILGCHLLFALIWILKRSKWALLSLFVLALSYWSFGDFLKFRGSAIENNTGFSLMSYNAKGFNRFGWIKIPKAGDSISAFMKEVDPDILCIQEHNLIRNKQLRQYPNKMATPSGTHKSKQAIFSKFPIIGEGSLDLPKSGNNIVFADIVIATDTIRVYNVHLESFKIVPDHTDVSSKTSERLYQRITSTIERQRAQVQLLNQHISGSPYKVVVCGDFNNTQFFGYIVYWPMTWATAFKLRVKALVVPTV